MKKLPISFKVALWSFLIATLAMGSALVGVTVLFEQELLATVDQSRDRQVGEIFRIIDQHVAQTDSSLERLESLSKDVLPKSALSAFIEIVGSDGRRIFVSPPLKGESIASDDDKPHDQMYHKQPMRVVTYHHGPLKLAVGIPMASTVKMLDRVKNASLLAVPVAALLSLIGGYWVGSRALRPVRELINAARSITAEDLHRRLPMPQAKDDIQRLTCVLNDTFDRLERSYLQAVRFASDASHQLKTPVTVMRAAIEALLRDTNLRADQVTTLHDLMDQTRRLSSLTEGLLLLAKADAGRIDARPTPVNLVPIMERCIEDAEVLGSNQHIRIERKFPTSVFALADTERMEQVFLNLLENAVKYNFSGGVIRVEAGTRVDGVVITIGNSGPPIPPERAPWIFNRFARGDRDETRAGHGLGLSIAKELITAQGGDLRLSRSDLGWTEFEIRLASPEALASGIRSAPMLTQSPEKGKELAGNPG